MLVRAGGWVAVERRGDLDRAVHGVRADVLRDLPETQAHGGQPVRRVEHEVRRGRLDGLRALRRGGLRWGGGCARVCGVCPTVNKGSWLLLRAGGVRRRKRWLGVPAQIDCSIETCVQRVHVDGHEKYAMMTDDGKNARQDGDLQDTTDGEPSTAFKS